MDNIISYAEKYLDTMNKQPFNVVDSLILSQLSYIHLTSFINNTNNITEDIKIKDLLKAEFFNNMFTNVPEPDKTKSLLFYAAANPRFRDIKINYYISKNNKFNESQFSAVTYILSPDSAYIAFRGTDYSINGWKEDFNMSFTYPVPCQQEGVEYLNYVAKLIPHNIYVGGHSKGGNISIYSSMYCNKLIKPRIKNVYSHDGPGFNETILTSIEYDEVKDKIIKLLPSSSIVGMIFENDNNFRVVKTNKTLGILQHDPFSWEILNNNFNFLDTLSFMADFRSTSINQWLNSISVEKRKIFINTLFEAIDSTKCTTFTELVENWKDNLPIILDSLKNIDLEIRNTIITVIKNLISIYIKNICNKPSSLH